MRSRWFPRLAVGLCAAVCAGACDRATMSPPKVESTLLEQQVRLEKGQVQKLPFEVRATGELKLEVVHLSGEPVRFLMFDKQALTHFEQSYRDIAKVSLSFYTAMSQPRVEDRFDSGWQQFTGAAVYSFVMWAVTPTTVDRPFNPSVVNVRLVSR